MPYQFREHEDFLEVRLEGVIDSVVHFERGFRRRTGNRNVLLDYSGVTEVRVDTYSLAAQARQAESLGFRVAVYAPRPLLFGLSRQALQLANVAEGVSASVFTDLDAAEEWLKSG